MPQQTSIELVEGSYAGGEHEPTQQQQQRQPNPFGFDAFGKSMMGPGAAQQQQQRPGSAPSGIMGSRPPLPHGNGSRQHSQVGAWLC